MAIVLGPPPRVPLRGAVVHPSSARAVRFPRRAGFGLPGPRRGNVNGQLVGLRPQRRWVYRCDRDLQCAGPPQIDFLPGRDIGVGGN